MYDDNGSHDNGFDPIKVFLFGVSLLLIGGLISAIATTFGGGDDDLIEDNVENDNNTENDAPKPSNPEGYVANLAKDIDPHVLLQKALKPSWRERSAIV